MPSTPSARTVAPALALAAACWLAAAPPAAAARLHYPETRKVDQVDDYHGVKVADPYRWLEQDVREAPEVRRWVEAENRVTFDYLGKIPQRPAIERRLTELWNYAKWSPPVKHGSRYFFTRNDGLQNQAVLYVQDSLVEDPRPLLDPNGWSQDGTLALAGTQVSPDGRWLAYGVAEAGSDWTTWHVVDVASGEKLADELHWIKFGGAAWTHDDAGFFYSRYPEPQEGQQFQAVSQNQAVWYHRLGTDQADDVLVYRRPEQPDWGYGVETTDDGRYLVLSIWQSTYGNRLYVRDLASPYATPRPLIDDFDDQHEVIYNRGPEFFVLTNRGAPRGRVVAIDLAHPEPSAWRDVLPESDATLQGADVVGNLLVARYLRDAQTAVRVFTLAGKPVRDVDLPGIGTAAGFTGQASDSETFYSFQSFATPPSIYRYDLVSGQSTLLRRPDVDFDPADFVVEQVFYTSKDGTRVPMFIAHRKDLELDGARPTLLYGYGGFDVSLPPRFSVEDLAWMEMGGVYAQPNLRGGGEYGEAWHQAGTKLHKQNVFDDFIAAAEWLVTNGVTRPEKLAISGASNGGLLVGAAMTQRPDLFGAALPAVGVMDMLRFDRFTAGRFWVADYGSSSDPEQFAALYAYSPYHNLRAGTRYPATLVTTADHDDRVVPGHSFKFAARLQEDQAGDAPVLIRIETRAGHGAGKPTSKQIAEAADALAFLVRNLGMEVPAGDATAGAGARAAALSSAAAPGAR